MGEGWDHRQALRPRPEGRQAERDLLGRLWLAWPHSRIPRGQILHAHQQKVIILIKISLLLW